MGKNMPEMKTYHEMNVHIVSILREFPQAHCRYAALRIEELEAEVEELTGKLYGPRICPQEDIDGFLDF
jgi:hypothetical protein